MKEQNNDGISNHRYCLGYHVMPKSGWINDPNGFSFFNDYYHIFYQHYPYEPQWGPMHWGHARSKDLVHWETLPIALTPGDKEDKDGCFSGTGIVKDEKLYLFYTGHHYYDDNDPDHFWQNQNMAYSQDGVHFTKYQQNAVIPEPPQDNTQHFRDPKVWQHGDYYYMIVGSQNTDELGRIILYRSKDLLSWDYIGPVDVSNGQEIEGYMWECPDIFELDGKHILLFSPQGMKAEKEQYLNLFQNGYFVGHFNYDSHQFTRNHFKELDHGHDFYAPQTMLAPDGRRILIGWMAMWNNAMPEQVDGWSGALTLPRELRLKDDHLYMTPVEELKQLRKDIISCDYKTVKNKTLLVEDIAQTEINLSLSHQNFKIQMTDEKNDLLSINFNADNNKFTLFREDLLDSRYATIQSANEIHLQIFIDTSSLELFINDGEAVFTERFYSETPPKLWLSAEAPINMSSEIYELEDNAIRFD